MQFCGDCGTYLFGEFGFPGQVPVNVRQGEDFVAHEQLRAIRDKDFNLWSLPLTRYSGFSRDPPYCLPSLPDGAEEYLAERAKHYDYFTKVYTGSCHCQAVRFGVVCKPLEEVLIIDCSCSMCLGVS